MRQHVGSRILTRLVHPRIRSDDLASLELVHKYTTTNSSRNYTKLSPRLLWHVVRLRFNFYVLRPQVRQMMRRRLASGVAACLQARNWAGHTTCSLSSTLLSSYANGVRSILTYSCWRSLLRSMPIGKLTVESSHSHFVLYCIRLRLTKRSNIYRFVLEHPLLLV